MRLRDLLQCQQRLHGRTSPLCTRLYAKHQTSGRQVRTIAARRAAHRSAPTARWCTAVSALEVREENVCFERHWPPSERASHFQRQCDLLPRSSALPRPNREKHSCLSARGPGSFNTRIHDGRRENTTSLPSAFIKSIEHRFPTIGSKVCSRWSKLPREDLPLNRRRQQPPRRCVRPGHRQPGVVVLTVGWPQARRAIVTARQQVRRDGSPRLHFDIA